MNYQLSFIFFLFLLYSIWDLSYYPNYDPFDEEKKISRETLLSDGCELLSAPCGYRTYGKEIDGNVIYYQFNPGEKNEVCAKGICIHIDSTVSESELAINSISPKRHEILIKKLLSEEVDSSRLLLPLLKFGVQNIPYSELKIDSSSYFDLIEQEILTKAKRERIWFFIDKNGQTYSTGIDFKIGRDSKDRSIIIRTLELFVSPKHKQ